MYAIGLSVGPGFLNALKAQGLPLNLLAASVVLLGVILTLLVHWVAGIDMPIAVGIFSGATTNTPSLAAASQALRDHPPSLELATSALAQAGMAIGGDPETAIREVVKLPSLGYAIAYPFGVVGIILSILILRAVFKVNPVDETRALYDSMQSQRPKVDRLNLRVTNPNLEGLKLKQIPGLISLQVTVSRIWQQEQLFVPGGDTVVHVGDVMLAVGTPENLEQLRIVVGERSSIDLMQAPGEVTYRWAVVTDDHVVGETVDNLHLADRFGVQITRIRRSEVEMPMMAGLRLGLGDQLLIVGRKDSVAAVAKRLGDLPKELEKTDLVPLFVGIAPGGQLGDAADLVARAIERGQVGVGRRTAVGRDFAQLHRSGRPLDLPIADGGEPRAAGDGDRDLLGVSRPAWRRPVVESVTSGDGVWWLGAGVLITTLPLLIVGAVAHWVMKLNYPTLVGVLAGSMTDPPALAFANTQTESELPAIAYATVIPLTMILRVLATQGLVLWGT